MLPVASRWSLLANNQIKNVLNILVINLACASSIMIFLAKDRIEENQIEYFSHEITQRKNV